jgi:hypothetical protein
MAFWHEHSPLALRVISREGWQKRMMWKKLGQIFDPTRHKLPNNCVEFAQSPQALVFDDFVRIYFSTRAIDPANGKFLSHVAFADFDLDFSRELRVSAHEVIPLGGLGAFDEHGIFPFHVVRRPDGIHAYTCGWSRRVSVSVETGIGLAATHDNGNTFTRLGEGPVLSATLNEPCLVGDGFVKHAAGAYHMWYIFGTGWRRFDQSGPPDRTYKIGHAISDDGVNWRKEEAVQIIEDRLGPDESQALPSVIEIDGCWHMVFCYRQSYDFRKNTGRGYRIGHAWSADLFNWTRDDEMIPLDVTPGQWDSEMQCYPHLFTCQGRTYMLYNGNEFGRFGFGLAVLTP